MAPSASRAVLMFMGTSTLQVRVVNGAPPSGDYSFAKYNKVCTKLPQPSLEGCLSSCGLGIFQLYRALLFSFVNFVQSVDVIKYTDEEYEKYLTDPVGIK